MTTKNSEIHLQLQFHTIQLQRARTLPQLQAPHRQLQIWHA